MNAIALFFLGNRFAHVLNNAVKNSHDLLPIDVELILSKLYSHFSRSAKRVEKLKEYFEFVQQDYLVSGFMRLNQ